MPDIGALLQGIRHRADELRNHHRLAAAIRVLGAGTLRDYASAPPAVRHVVKDKASYLLVQEILRVCYAQPRAATAAAFKRGIVQFKFSSKGRAGTLIDFMRSRGLLVRPPGGEERILAPGADLVAYRRALACTGAEALRELGSDVAGRIDMTDDAMVREYILVAAEVAQRFPDVVYPADPPTLALFFHRDAGLLVLYSILEALDGNEPTAEGRLSVSGIARRTGVSRAHILKMLADAHAQGVVVWDKEHHGIRLTPQLHDQMGRFFAGILAWHEAILARAEQRRH